MRLISWNVNGFRAAARKGSLTKLLDSYNPDVLMLQEIKCTGDELMDTLTVYLPNCLDADNPEAYTVFITESKVAGRHGVAMLVRNRLMDMSETNGEFNPEMVDPYVDNRQEGRLQIISLNGYALFNTYTVNVRTGDKTVSDCRIPQRQLYDEHVYNLVNQCLTHSTKKIIFMGDFNVVRELVDYHGPQIHPGLAGMTPEEREGFSNIMDAFHFVDTFRHVHENKVKYSYWSYRGDARASNKGWRIDYGLVTVDMIDEIVNADILTEINGSDHAPILLDIEEVM